MIDWKLSDQRDVAAASLPSLRVEDSGNERPYCDRRTLISAVKDEVHSAPHGFETRVPRSSP